MAILSAANVKTATTRALRAHRASRFSEQFSSGPSRCRLHQAAAAPISVDVTTTAIGSRCRRSGFTTAAAVVADTTPDGVAAVAAGGVSNSRRRSLPARIECRVPCSLALQPPNRQPFATKVLASEKAQFSSLSSTQGRRNIADVAPQRSSAGLRWTGECYHRWIREDLSDTCRGVVDSRVWCRGITTRTTSNHSAHVAGFTGDQSGKQEGINGRAMDVKSKAANGSDSDDSLAPGTDEETTDHRSPSSGEEATADSAATVGAGEEESGRETANAKGMDRLARYSKRLKKLAYEGDGIEAMKVLAKIRREGFIPTPKQYSSAISACGNGGMWRQAISLLREAREVSKVQGDEVGDDPHSAVARGPDGYHYAAAIKACAMARQTDKVIALMSEMRDLKLVPSVVCFNAAIKSAANSVVPSGKRGPEAGSQKPTGLKLAVGLLREMSQKGVTPNEMSYTLAMKACKKAGRPEDALALLREMPSPSQRPSSVVAREDGEDLGPADDDSGDAGGDGSGDGSGNGDGTGGAAVRNIYHYTTVASAFAQQEDGWKHVVALLKEMEAEGIAPNHMTYSVAIAACARDGQWAQAVALLRQMPKIGVVPDEASYTSAIEACGQGGQWALAVALVREMSTEAAASVSPTAAAYTAAIVACGEAGEWQLAIDLLDELRANDSPSAPATRQRVESKAASSKASEASEVSEVSEASGGQAVQSEAEVAKGRRRIQPDVAVYNAAISACGKNGQWERALELLADLSKAGAASSPAGRGLRLAPDVISYNATIAVCASEGQWEVAVALLGEMEGAGVAPVSASYLPVIEACKRAGRHTLVGTLMKRRHDIQKNMRRRRKEYRK